MFPVAIVSIIMTSLSQACLQSACGAPFGIGSDIGGSIRMPSFFNGIFGHKPTYGKIATKYINFSLMRFSN